MAASTSIILLLLVTMVAARPDLDAYFKLIKDIKDRPSAEKSAKLQWDTVRALGTYFCGVGSKQCGAIREYLLEWDLEKNGSSAQEVKNTLVGDADKIFGKTQLILDRFNALREALFDVICDEEPGECDFWR